MKQNEPQPYAKTVADWKKQFAVAVAIAIILFLIIITSWMMIDQVQILKFGDVEISKGDFEDLSEAVNTTDFQLCDIVNNKCVRLRKNK